MVCIHFVDLPSNEDAEMKKLAIADKLKARKELDNLHAEVSKC